MRQSRSPRRIRRQLELLAELASRREARVEDRRVSRDLARRDEVWKLLASRHLRRAIGVAIEHASATDHARTDLTLQRLQRAKQTVDRTTRRVLALDVHADRQKPI